MKNVGLLLFLITLSASSSYAHNYLEPLSDGSTAIPNIDVSFASYLELNSETSYRVYAFEAAAGQEIYIQMTIPRLDRLADFTPSFALIFPSGVLTPPSPLSAARAMLSDDPRGLPAGAMETEAAVLVVSASGEAAEAFHEPVTGTDYWMRQDITLVAPANGEYRIVVYDPQGRSGKYVLATGRAERFGLRDIFRLPGIWWDVRGFMERPRWTLPVFGSLFVLGIGGVVTWAILRPRS